MSLDSLLDNNVESSEWKQQRKKFIRIIFGVTLIALAIVVAVIIFPKKPEKNETELANAEALSELMSLRKEAKELQNELSKIKPENETAPVQRAKRAPAATYSTKSSHSQELKVVNYDPGEPFVNLQDNKDEIYIPTGAVFQARLITPIKTSVAKTFVIAETTHEFRMDMQRRIPKGSRLIGRSRLNPVLKGVIVEFETLVLPKGIETSLSGLALSRNALPEIDGLYFSDKLQTYGTALAFGFLSGFADSAKEREATIYGSQPTASISNQVLAGLSTASFQVAEDILRDVRESAVEYVVVPAGEPIFVALTRRYVVNNEGNSQ